MSSRGVLAIDFGTANTYFCKCPNDQTQATGVDFDGDGHDGLDTAILYREGKEPLVGRIALAEFGDATADERRSYTFRAQFKPDIVTSSEARDHATAFLKTVLVNARRQFLDIDPADRRVIFGVPAEADQLFRHTLADIARTAGYGSIETREEPLGGMFYHVANKTIAPSDALRGLLVIDFGGGTCDFAFMYRGKISKCWGDMYLGGRVFDDLFYQWLMEQNPKVAAALKPADEFYVISHLCRELKEGFSREMMKRMCAGTFSRTVGQGQYGRLSDATWPLFVERAARYRPSPAFAEHLRAMGASLTLIDKDEPTDLIGWFKECLVDGLAKTGVDRSDIATVILTGGSSQWPFVPEIVREVLYVDPGRIRRSDRPYAAIAQGLAIEPALRRAHETTRQKLEVDLPRFLREKVGKLVDEYIQGAANDIADTITSELFDGQVKPTLVQFRENGGTIAELKAKVAIQAQRFEPQIQSIVTSVTDLISKGLPVLVLDELRKWFEANGLRIDRDMLEVSGDRIATTDVGMVELHDMLQGFNRVVAGVTGTIVGAVAASVCGGGGTALIASGPIGGLIGLVIGAALAYVAVTAGMGAARARAEAIHLPSKVMWLALRDAKIDSARRKLRTETHEQIFRELYKLRATLNGQLENLVMKEIAALTELHHL